MCQPVRIWLNNQLSQTKFLTSRLWCTKYNTTVPWWNIYKENILMSPFPLLHSVGEMSSWLSLGQKQWGYAEEAVDWVQNPSCTPVWASGRSEAAGSMAPPAACWRRRASGTASLTLFWFVGKCGRGAWRSEDAATPTQTGRYTIA